MPKLRSPSVDPRWSHLLITDPTVFPETGMEQVHLYRKHQAVSFRPWLFQPALPKYESHGGLPSFTLVPGKFFDRKRAKAFTIIFTKQGERSSTIHRWPASILFTIWTRRSIRSFPQPVEPHFRHQASTLLSLFATRAVERGERCCSSIFMTGLSPLAFDEGFSPRICSRLPTLRIPFTTYQRVGEVRFDQSADSLLLSGNLDAHSEVIEKLSKFIAKVEQTELQPKTNLSEEQLRTLPTDTVAMLCES